MAVCWRTAITDEQTSKQMSERVQQTSFKHDDLERCPKWQPYDGLIRERVFDGVAYKRILMSESSLSIVTDNRFGLTFILEVKEV